ncbi:tRNA lysidine(34) synthetase TilS [Lactobacillus sp. Sy-1]|uniref:tRNA lysidine(34) synthetase TilS n=1 Tax=Lactobacillus sp. Sy-1 TaxID=2109645 RepID=UPI001C56F428|nr:tRNA lysidine(34) synthetase TilS [Lactobacillus sp. Sy-1]MBW1604775.1 tRNA lysidine(34) synthetase TilS [Lactobacillus sp. Sy-1]
MKLSLRKQFARTVKQNHWWHSGQAVVVAVSTGVDSMVLLDLLQHLRIDVPKIIVAHFNHGLRTASKVEQEYITDYCKTHGIQLAVDNWPAELHPDAGVESAARKVRYAFFKRVMQANDAKFLITAHHQNDQAETVLMKLIRGGNLEQLRAIRVKRPFGNGFLVRPLLQFSKATLIQYAQEAGIKWYEDATNHDDVVERNRIRHQILPLMERENPQVINNITNFATQLSNLIDANQYMIQQLLERMKTANGYQLISFLELPMAIQNQLLKGIGLQLSQQPVLTDKQIKMVSKILNNAQKPQGRFTIGAHLMLVKAYDEFKLEFSKNVKKNAIKINRIMVRLNHWYRIDSGVTIGVFERQKAPKITDGRTTDFKLGVACLPLVIRPWQSTDRITLKSGGHQKVKRILIDQKVASADRKKALVLVDQQNRVISLLGYKDSTFPIENSGGMSLQLLVWTEFERRIP